MQYITIHDLIYEHNDVSFYKLIRR